MLDIGVVLAVVTFSVEKVVAFTVEVVINFSVDINFSVEILVDVTGIFAVVDTKSVVVTVVVSIMHTSMENNRVKNPD